MASDLLVIVSETFLGAGNSVSVSLLSEMGLDARSPPLDLGDIP